MPPQNPWESLLNLSEAEASHRKREFNRAPLQDLFPRIPSLPLERILDSCLSKNFTYNLSLPRLTNARRLNSIVIAHVRHTFSDYDRLLREEGVERFEARRRCAGDVWRVLREWCPWDGENEGLGRCFEVTLLRREERGEEWDLMDLDVDSEEGGEGGEPMDLD